MMAQAVILRTGKTIEGTVLMQNDEVVILQTTDGRRFQYPASEVLSIQEYQHKSDIPASESVANTANNFAARIQLHGGAVYLPMKGWGGQAAVDIALGAKQINLTPIFLGASLGYRANCFADQVYSFIPLQVVLSMPLTTCIHAPAVGFSVGYGFSANPNTKGGICLGVDLGWIYRFKKKSSISLGVNVEWQQTQTDVLQEITNPDKETTNQYVNNIGADFLTIGSKLTIQF
jgi:hypothetical protein